MSNQITVFNNNLTKMDSQFKAALPAHISVEKFKRTALTAMQQTPDLYNCDQGSVFQSLVQCASDGLLPNGKEAALVIHNCKTKDGWIKKAQYFPMVAGVRKMLFNSSEIVNVEAHVVHENDDFRYQLGDNPHIHHSPAIGNRGEMILAYCIITLKSGGVIREIMQREEILQAKECSKSKDKEGRPTGPWKEWESEMWRKTVIHRASKAAPKSSDLEKFLEQDMARILGDKQEKRELKDVTNYADAISDISTDDFENDIVAEAHEVGDTAHVASNGQ